MMKIHKSFHLFHRNKKIGQDSFKDYYILSGNFYFSLDRFLLGFDVICDKNGIDVSIKLWAEFSLTIYIT